MMVSPIQPLAEKKKKEKMSFSAPRERITYSILLAAICRVCSTGKEPEVPLLHNVSGNLPRMFNRKGTGGSPTP
jgi:hypothetical protein